MGRRAQPEVWSRRCPENTGDSRNPGRSLQPVAVARGRGHGPAQQQAVDRDRHAGCTWDEVKEGARAVIDQSDRSGNGAAGGAVWLPEAEWGSHPVDTTTGKEKSPEEWNWPATNWEDGTVDSDPTYRYPYGGEEHRHEPAIDDELPLNPEDAAEMSPLSRPVASWSESDLRRVMASSAYWQPNHPGRARAHAMVREWFERAETAAPARADASGPPAPEPATSVSSADGGCEVPVQAHTRTGGKVEVEAHCRSRPVA